MTSSAFPGTALLQVSTLDDKKRIEIGAHIWVCRKRPEQTIPSGVPIFTRGYDRGKVWPKDSLAAIQHLNKASRVQ